MLRRRSVLPKLWFLTSSADACEHTAIDKWVTVLCK